MYIGACIDNICVQQCLHLNKAESQCELQWQEGLEHETPYVFGQLCGCHSEGASSTGYAQVQILQAVALARNEISYSPVVAPGTYKIT